MGKGPEYEREICKRLSLWWTGDLRDDVFWRTANSGGRATVRNRSQKKTAGQYGDIGATDPCGMEFISAVTLEIKRGYSKFSFGDLLDVKPTAAEQCYEKFLEQAITAHKNAGSKSWWLIVRRDRRDPLVVMPQRFWDDISDENRWKIERYPFFNLSIVLGRKTPQQLNIVGSRLEDFLKCTKPETIRPAAKRQ